jgi:ureidoglycolate lyase
MIVLGRRRVEFVVTQFANGVAEDDCQEVLVEGVEIGLEGLPEGVIDVGAEM